MTAAQAAPYETLARIVERELELIGEGRLDELDALKAERAALVASLPERPPACARPALERAALLQRRVAIEIMRRREAVVLELARLEQVRRTAEGYTPPRESSSHLYASA
jgi:hypothetical protein